MEFLTVIDMKTLSQSELHALSLCSSSAYDLRRTIDVVVPKIDRKIFNESAGSRRQTHFHLRPNSSDAVARRIRLLSHARTSLTPYPNDPVLAESRSIINHLKKLINGNEPENPTVDHSQPPSTAMTQAGNRSGVPSVAGDMDVSCFSGERKRKRRWKKKPEVVGNGGVIGNSPANRSQLPSTGMTLAGDVSGVSSGAANMGIMGFSGERKKKRRRKEKPKVVENGEIELEIVNKNGVVVDFRALENCDELFGDELRKRTIGLESEEAFLGFLGGLEGKWGSTRKKRRIVDASEFCDALPVGWKLLLALKRQQYRPSVYCRRYIRCFFS